MAETILHDLDPADSFVSPGSYRGRALSAITVTRPIRLASLHGASARRLRIIATEVTATDPDAYSLTVAWAAAAHAAGFDGLAYMSRLCNTDRAFILFGDRVAPDALTSDITTTLAFGDSGPGLTHLVDLCAPMRLHVLAY